MRKYESPEVEIMNFKAEDIVRTSNTLVTSDPNETPIIRPENP